MTPRFKLKQTVIRRTGERKIQIIYKVNFLCFLYEKLRNGPLPRSIKGTAGNSPSSVRRKETWEGRAGVA